MMYGGMGMGFGYSNGLLTGLIIGSMMHPNGTVMYNGGGMYGGNALLYPNGQVVNQQGYQVGTYANGQFAPVQNGAMVAQQVPGDAQRGPDQPMVIGQAPQPPGLSAAEIVGIVVLSMAAIVLLVVLLAMLF
jgi:hypothetical protein